MREQIVQGVSSVGNMFTHIVYFVGNSRWTEITTMTPLMRGILLQIFVISMIVIMIRVFRKTKFGIAFSLLFESMYEFFEEILGKQQRKTFKMYVVTLFFVILISNLLSYTIDLIRIVFMDIEALPKYIVIPTTDFNFNLALALVSIIIM
ncbi:MAG TPA: F0F1 ATP synthase subunit A, partial [Candidatus Absconditabacterales bacterium]|nr:F0F1 ATP synthase subunit A [Candidatus Absconditabacterales bacterium]